MLYDVAIISKPSKKEIEEGTGAETLVLAPVSVLAADPQGAVVAVVLANADKLSGVDMSKTSVLVRPFA